ncbi:hypothetical protein S887_003585 [Salmonella enterica subsp. diarizonae]|nr:hypothetical protein [Salmonella enterica subsp. diarizonae]
MKYELTNITQYYNGVALRRIRALRDSELSGFKRGDIGGWIQTTDNLSQEGECWIHHDARVLGNARVTGDCRISDYAEISGNARVSGYSRVFGHAHICCGEDGPQILSDVWINFDIDYDTNYAIFVDGRDAGLIIAVSQNGSICVAGNWDFDGFFGDLPAFKQWAQKHSKAAVRLLPGISYWLSQ